MAPTFIGLMSGTSADAVDGVAVSFDNGAVNIQATQSDPISPSLRERITDIMRGRDDHLDAQAALDVDLSHAFADCAEKLIARLDALPQAIGCHGQTVRHRPEKGFTVQLGSGAFIATRTGVPTVTDFRSADIALGGQGAPLVPAFHQDLFGSDEEDRAIVNIGGIANVTLLPKDASVSGFDTGPGNTLLDYWYREHHEGDWDTDGAWSLTGKVDQALLKKLLSDKYFSQPAPKSTGLEYFSHEWLKGRLSGNEHPQDVQAMLRELTAATIADAITNRLAHARTVYLCGGGAQNKALKDAIRALLPNTDVTSTARLGIEPQWVEACAFAWLARQRLEGRPGNLPSVTGASRATVLGTLHQP
ncbi:MAG: anhydro-N-acetylmuramic acid kinase [Acidiferrobacteraceae bacterium]|jgi:anhydro-N-acetylmuramic acid kinase|nr:anhydro-N-acetylmuramic acid kinase [Acidiferrobacteraceae bacterium]MDP6397581.1 anhydro-N-acetylmuramic acid kinase [Arenicellales bacterium]MDP6552002.1 anhydro-N-acetylmuramic acid kinase [Arenicellales bacterium]MDP6919105.1 anhydro-N-acetylmuramic acid kinase [Arenicellales bacterium]|tara:strand:+ start:3747 stop:4829 length:1083 start_codon:yes stop_codon:yes gene_type:complete